MEIRYLKTFQTIVKTGSFSKAAEELNYTQSTITFQMGQLEAFVSAQLFEKVGRRMVLTKAGKALMPYVDDVLQAVLRLENFDNELSSWTGELRVGVGETLLSYKLPDILKEFHYRAPKVKLLLRSMNCYEIRDELLQGKLDIGVFYNDIGGLGSSLEMKSMGEYPLVLVASPSIAAQYEDFVSPHRELSIPFIINEPNCIFRQLFERYLQERSIILDHTIELWSIETIKRMVASDVGVSFLPRFTVEEELQKGVLTEIPIDMKHVSITAVCSYHKHRWCSPSMSLFTHICTKNGISCPR